MNKYYQSRWLVADPLKVVIRKTGTSFSSFSLPKPFSPAAAKGKDPKANEELDFLKSSHH